MTYFLVGCEVDISTWRVKRTGIFIDQPPSYVKFEDEHKVHKLKKKKKNTIWIETNSKSLV